MLHVLIIDVSHGNTDDIGSEALEGIPDSLVGVFLEHEVDQSHIMTRPSGGGGNAGESQREGRHVHRFHVCGNQQNIHRLTSPDRYS